MALRHAVLAGPAGTWSQGEVPVFGAVTVVGTATFWIVCVMSVNLISEGMVNFELSTIHGEQLRFIFWFMSTPCGFPSGAVGIALTFIFIPIEVAEFQA